MRIGYYGRGLANRAGIGRYSRELLNAIRKDLRGHSLRVFAGPPTLESLPGGDFDPIPIPGSGGRVWEEQIGLPAALRSHPVDLLHNPDFTLPVATPRGLRTVVTVHDVAYARLSNSNSWRSKMLLSAFVPHSIRRADAVIAVSDFTKREVVDLYGVDPAKIHVIPNAVDERFQRPNDDEIKLFRERHGLPSVRLVLYLGAIEERKNLVRLAQAVRRIPGATLALGGSKNRNAEQILSQIRSELGDRLILLGYVPDPHLPTLYASATLFAYPSLYEGFGLQPLEAMACGTPVAVSRAASLPEVTGASAEHFNPLDFCDMSDAIERVLDDPDRQIELREAGRRRAATFSWRQVAKETLDLYEQVIGA